jgi:hypothetical protein
MIAGASASQSLLFGCRAFNAPKAEAAVLSAAGSSGGTAPQATICAPVASVAMAIASCLRKVS